MNDAAVDHEITILCDHILRLGEDKKDGTIVVKYGVLFKDDKCQNTLEALVGTLRAAKRKGILTFQGQMLLSPVHDAVDVVLTKDKIPAKAAAAAAH